MRSYGWKRNKARIDQYLAIERGKAIMAENVGKLTDRTEQALDLADRQAEAETRRLTHEEVFASVREKTKE